MMKVYIRVPCYFSETGLLEEGKVYDIPEQFFRPRWMDRAEPEPEEKPEEKPKEKKPEHKKKKHKPKESVI